MARRVAIAELMQRSGVTFGTSGARGLVQAMTDEVCVAYTLAFAAHLATLGWRPQGAPVAVAGDLRPSTPRILEAVGGALASLGAEPVYCGRIPTPALALHGLTQRMPAIMVTGSHIPDDRNGIKFHTTQGEIGKADEAGIAGQTVTLPDWFDAAGMLRPDARHPLPPATAAADEAYVQRYVGAAPANAFAGRRIVVYGHSSVARELLAEVFAQLGAEVVRVGWSERFVPVDTEAIRAEDIALARDWAAEHAPFAIVSADGDADRPLLADESGQWLRGDIAGLLTARVLAADVVACPVSCNTAVERSAAFARVVRTRIGSPYVIAAMEAACAAGGGRVVGYEANGGFLTASPLALPGGGTLAPLPTRDALIVHLAVLLDAVQRGVPVSALAATLPARHTASDRLENFPTARSRALLDELASGGAAAITARFPALGPVADIDQLDGLRITFRSGDILHLRPSGNAPELRCYTEADSEQRARALCQDALEVLDRLR